MTKANKPKLTMSLFDVSSRDQIHQEILDKISLNRYDIRFMSNIYIKYIHQNKPLSVNQNEVYEKLIHKYRKQFRRLGVRYRDILALTWRHGIMTAAELQKKTFLRLVNKDGVATIELFFPYREELKKEMQAIIHDDECSYLNIESQGKWSGHSSRQYDFRWYAEEGMYRGPFNLHLFRNVYDWCIKHDILIDSYVQDFADKLNARGSVEDCTTHIKIVDNTIVVNNPVESMKTYLAKIDYNDITAENIERICELGITPPDEVADIADFMAADAMNGVAVTSLDDLERLQEYLRRTNRKAIWIREGTIHKDQFRSRIHDELRSNTVPILQNLNWDSPILQIENARYTEEFIRQIQPALDKASENRYNTVIVTSPLDEVLRSQSLTGKIALAANKVIYLLIGKT